MKRVVLVLMIAVMVIVMAGCATDASVASRNLSKAADQFEVLRRIVFYNGITGEYILTIEGLCSLGGSIDAPRELTVTCKTGMDQYKKHFLGLSDNVTYFAEQLEPNPADVFRYRVIFKPEVIVPDVDLELRNQE
jgi:hypothetical protein